MYKTDCSKEKEPVRNIIFEPGWHTWEVVSIDNKPSKAGNPMFTVELGEEKTMETMNIYMIAVEEKQWMLKSFLTALDAPKNVEGIFEWDESHVIGKRLQGFIENKEEEYTDRKGETKYITKSKIVSMKSIFDNVKPMEG